MKDVEFKKFPPMGGVSEESIEAKFERLRRKVEDMYERQEATLSYLENMMGVELVRNVRNSRLRFADKDTAD